MTIEQNIEHTVSIVTAFLGNNVVAATDLPGVIQRVYDAISSAAAPREAPAPALPEPAVSIRASVKPDHVTCLECGKKAKMLKRHIMRAHGMDEAAYRARWGLSADHPLVAPNYAEVRRTLAKQIGLGRAPTKGRGR